MSGQGTKRITVKEAAERAAEVLGRPVADETVRGWLRRGLVRGVKLAGNVYVVPESLEEFLTPKPYAPPDGQP